MNVTVHNNTVSSRVTYSQPKQTGWDWVREHWFSATWMPIPDWVKVELRLQPKITGVCSGMFCTKQSAEGANDFIRRLNQIGVSA